MSRSARWPSGRDYVEAVQDAQAFGPDDLRVATIRTAMFGMPASASGQNAIVFPFDTATGPEAVKCFTSQPSDTTRHRYRILTDHLVTHHDLPLARAAWVERAVRVDGHWWPAVRMPWLPGTTLDLAVEDRLDRPDELRALAAAVRTMGTRLVAARCAHGDLQHGNILVAGTDADGTLTLNLVDYDSVWLPGAESLPPDEVGHRNYQHPERSRTGWWGPGVDTFSALVIHLSLLALAADPTLWETYHHGENLVLSEADYRDPGTSPAVAALQASTDPEVVRQTEILLACLRAPLRALGTLDRLLDASGPDLTARTTVDISAPGANPEWLRVGEPDKPDQAGDHGWSAVPDDWVSTTSGGDFEFDPQPNPRKRRRWGRRR